MAAARTLAELEPLGELEGVRGEWEALEAGLEESPYVGFEWLCAWERAYRPKRLALLRVREGPQTVAVGLLELGPRGALRFAGRPATSECRLLCVPEMEASAWRALAELLRTRPRDGLEARGLSRDAASALPDGWAVPLSWLGLRLPNSFGEYLSGRSVGTRKGLKGKLRRAEREGVEARAVSDADRGAALRDFVRLHQLRAASKGQHHPAVDDRLVQMLELVGGNTRPRLFELIADRRRIGVTVRVDTARAGYFYNAGIDPEWAHISPGILLQLASIEDAIEAGLRRYDLGPGDFRYKRDLGGVLLERYQIAIPGRGLRVRLGRSRAVLVGRLRHRASVKRVSKRFADRSSIDATTT
jgi:CelD/BcsL family acetyltransferase involved in cellulose biosynthesis